MKQNDRTYKHGKGIVGEEAGDASMHSSRLTADSSFRYQTYEGNVYFFFLVEVSPILSSLHELLFLFVVYSYLFSLCEPYLMYGNFLYFVLCKCASKCTLNKIIGSFLPLNC